MDYPMYSRPIFTRRSPSFFPPHLFCSSLFDIKWILHLSMHAEWFQEEPTSICNFILNTATKLHYMQNDSSINCQLYSLIWSIIIRYQMNNHFIIVNCSRGEPTISFLKCQLYSLNLHSCQLPPLQQSFMICRMILL